jgi:hypothetical protein
VTWQYEWRKALFGSSLLRIFALAVGPRAAGPWIMLV